MWIREGAGPEVVRSARKAGRALIKAAQAGRGTDDEPQFDPPAGTAGDSHVGR